MIRWLLLAAAGLAAAGLLLREETGAPPAPAAAPVPGALASAGTGTLSIEVEGLEGGAGQVALALFDGAAGFESGRALSSRAPTSADQERKPGLKFREDLAQDPECLRRHKQVSARPPTGRRAPETASLLFIRKPLGRKQTES